MKKIVLKILIFVNVFVFAQNNPNQITIKGKVLDQFKKPISNVNITHNNFGTISSPVLNDTYFGQWVDPCFNHYKY